MIPVDRLAGDLCDQVEVRVVVQHRCSMLDSGCSDDQIWNGSPVLAAPGEQALVLAMISHVASAPCAAN